MKTPASSLEPAASARQVDWPSKLRHFLLVLAICLGIAALHLAFEPGKSYFVAAVYSLAIGLSTWATIDFGRHAFASSAETGWPPGAQGAALVAGGVALGYLVGSFAAGQVLHQLGWVDTTSAPQEQVRRTLLISLVAGLANTYYFYSRGRSQYLERKMAEARRHAAQARLKLLETQLEPHMLFNTLANLRALIGVDPQRAQQMLDHMIAYLRATLDASRATSHPLGTEFQRLGDYLSLMQVRMGPRLQYALELPAELAAQPVPTLLLQPLVENSIRHGLEPRVEGGHVRISARREGQALVLEVADTGVGAGSPAADGSGFGLAQVRERLATLHGPQAALQLGPNRPQGTCATVRLPLAP